MGTQALRFAFLAMFETDRLTDQPMNQTIDEQMDKHKQRNRRGTLVVNVALRESNPLNVLRHFVHYLPAK